MKNFVQNIKTTRNPFLLFLPFLVFFIIYILKLQNNAIENDESRYLYFAQNLIHGFYSPSPPGINLWNGPGYPIILIPFVLLHIPLVYATLLNGFLNYLSIILLFKALKQIVSGRVAFIFTLFWACYYPAYEDMLRLYTETFAYFLISLLAFSLIKAFNSNNLREAKKYIFLSGFTMGYLVLTKIAFGYALLFILICSVIMWVFYKKISIYKKVVIVMLIAFVTVLPYLIYTYRLTNKLFYFGNSGGMSLYWMSTPYESEYGDWFGNLTT